ncbi:hypothetical protein NQ318_007137 [Aromia moschata]|uniref:Transmembrane protein 184C n=1 Tax=Aromia moschata TaxID=1265417 RepID=A0AAV8XN33_9CUCU|nr:hypothetical protein NQ318_007137 [Aromia moschata]
MCLERCLECLSRWRLWIRPLFILLYAFAALVFVPFFLVKSVEDGFNKHDQEILIAGIFVWVAIPLSLLGDYTARNSLYAAETTEAYYPWLGLIYPEESVYVDSIRECYEAYVIYNFMKFLLNYLNMEMDLEASLELKPQVKHIFPLCCLPDWEMGREFVHICKHGILQYTVVRPLTTAISFICKVFDVYGDGQFKGNVAFPYLIAVNNVSQFVAMYCLVMFYKAGLAELRPMKPLPKFLCIKAPRCHNRLTVFSYEPYARPGSNNQSCCSAFLAMWDVSDVHTDIREHLGIVGSSISRRIRGRSMYTIPRGEDEYSNLVSPRAAESAPNPGIYQGECDELYVNNYGTVSSSQPAKVHNPRYKT